MVVFNAVGEVVDGCRCGSEKGTGEVEASCKINGVMRRIFARGISECVYGDANG